jgi:hypothetical protein
MRFRGVSIAVIGGVGLSLALGASDAGAQTRRLGVLRPPPRPSVGRGPLPRRATIARHFNACFFVPWLPFSRFFPSFGGVPFANGHGLASTQPVPDPTTHIVPNPSSHVAPFPGSHPVPSVYTPAVAHPVVNGVTSPHALRAFATPVYNAPVYSAPVYAPASPITTPQVHRGMVVGDVIVDPTFWLWGSSVFGGGVICAPVRSVGRTIIF